MVAFVLVHGSWHGGWCWRDVARLLREKGHSVHTPTLSGCAERFHTSAAKVTLLTHYEDVSRLLFYEDLKDVVLVGHSYAGMVIPGVANKAANRLRGLVYLDAYMVPPGQKGFDLWTPERLAEAQRAIAEGYPYRKPFTAEFLGVTEPQLAQWVTDRLTPHPLGCYDTIVEAEAPEAARLPRVYIQCTEGPIVPVFVPVVETLRERGWPIRTVDAGHDLMITHPEELTDLLIECAHELAAPMYTFEAREVHK